MKNLVKYLIYMSTVDPIKVASATKSDLAQHHRIVHYLVDIFRLCVYLGPAPMYLPSIYPRSGDTGAHFNEMHPAMASKSMGRSSVRNSFIDQSHTVTSGLLDGQ